MFYLNTPRTAPCTARNGIRHPQLPTNAAIISPDSEYSPLTCVQQSHDVGGLVPGLRILLPADYKMRMARECWCLI